MSEPEFIEDESELDAYDGPACMMMVEGTKVLIGLDCETVVDTMHEPDEWKVLTGKRLEDCYMPADDRAVDQWHYYEETDTLWISARRIALVCEVDAAPHKHERQSLFG